jgi:teichoic acid transport system permease protein
MVMTQPAGRHAGHTARNPGGPASRDRAGAAPRRPTVYEPTASGLPALRAYLRDLWERRPLIWHLARTDLKAQNYETTLGQAWVVLDPLLMAAVYYLFRSVVSTESTASARNEILSHLIWGVFVFYYTSNCVLGGARSLTSGRALILNSSFPRAALPLYEIVKSAMNFLPTLAVYLVLHAVLGRPFGFGLVALPVMVAIQTALNVGLALLFAPLMVFFRDVRGLLPYITRVWLYTSPALYSVAELPPRYASWLRWNPLYPFFAAYEQVFAGRLPSIGYVVAACMWALLFLVVGALVFLTKERDFAIRI